MALAPGPVSKAALACLLLQHSSSAWGEQSLEFAAYLFLITLYPTSFLPASFLGLGITVSAISATTWIGHKVDTEPRCSFVRRLIFVQKICQSLCYAIFLVLFRRVPPNSPDTSGVAIPWPLILLLTISASGGRISTTGIDLAVCRDWVLVISSHSASAHASSSSSSIPGEPNHLLTFLTTSLRRITLICKLLSPLLISLLTTTVGYQAASAILLGTAGMTLMAEVMWIGMVWRKFTVLEEQEVYRRPASGLAGPLESGHERLSSTPREEDSTSSEHLYAPLDQQGTTETNTRPSQQLGTRGRFLRPVHKALGQWNEFRKMPVFLSSISISCLYLTTLSFESILISYLKSEANLSDLFIAVMRGVSVTTGLLGTAVMPLLERKVGLVRAGAWSIWCEIASLLPVVLCLYIGPGPSAATSSFASITNTLIFFLALSLSRLWLYCFDLVQLQSLLVALEHHPRRSEFAAMQVTMENGFDLVKYLVVLVFNKPEQFKWTAVISLVAVFVAGITYSTYLYQVRGHVFHFGKKHDDANRDVSEQVEMRLMASDDEQSR